MKLFIVLFALLSLSANAQTPDAMAKDAAALKGKVKLKNGWNPKLNMGISYNLVDSDAWIGSDNGTNSTFGLNVAGAYDYKSERYEWRNSLSLVESSTKTPNAPTWLKSSDELKIETLYLYNLENYAWVSPYARASAMAPIFKGESISETNIQYQKKDANGVLQNDGTATQRRRLTDGFKPLTTRQSLGAYFKLIEEEKMKLSARLGYGAVQVAADGQLTVSDLNAAAGTATLNDLTDINQSGIELGFDLVGKFDDKTNYSLGFDALIPLTGDDNGDRDALELMNWEANAKVTSKLYEFLAISYEYRLREQPGLYKEGDEVIQKQHLFLANLTYTFF